MWLVWVVLVSTLYIFFSTHTHTHKHTQMLHRFFTHKHPSAAARNAATLYTGRCYSSRSIGIIGPSLNNLTCTHPHESKCIYSPSFVISAFLSQIRIRAGLPNVGKSTLFNALTETQRAEAENRPFCTIEPNVGIVNVPDERLDLLAEAIQARVMYPRRHESIDSTGRGRDRNRGGC